MSLRPPFFGSVKLTFQAGLLGSKGKSAVNPPVVRFRREVTMAPPTDNQNRPSREEMQKAIETAKQIAKQPFRLTSEERNDFKRAVLSAMGRDDD